VAGFESIHPACFDQPADLPQHWLRLPGLHRKCGRWSPLSSKTTVDVYAEYRLLKRLSVYASLSNLTGEPKRTYRYAPTTPEYARPFRYQDFGTLVTFGARTDF